MSDEQVPQYKDGNIINNINNSDGNEGGIIYSIEDKPPWYLCILLGLQHYLTMFGAAVTVPFILTPAFCIEEDDPARAYITSTVFFVSGLVTLLQTTFGIRLPIVQGTTFTFLVSTFAILNSNRWRLPVSDEMLKQNNLTMDSAFSTSWNCPTKELLAAGNWTSEDVWQPRIREIQGAVIVAALFEVLIGASGLIGMMLNKVTPLTIVPTITLVGLSLFKEAADIAGQEWGISLTTVFFLILLSEILKDVNIPLAKYSDKKCQVFFFPAFKLFPVLSSILLTWFICFVLTASDALPVTSPARTDQHNAISKSSWFRFPYPGQWGMPTVSTASVFGMLAGVLAGMIESIGDYYACARLSKAPPPPTHAINRGIMIEGLGCILAGLWGTGNGTTSFSENIGAIGVTKVASRRVVQVAACIMIILGMFSKAGAVFTIIPMPIVGGMFCIMFSIISAVGLSNLQYINLNSTRNLMILGLTLFMGLAVPNWIKANKSSINTGSFEVDQIIKVLLETSVFIGGSIGFILDNLIPGSDEERGIIKWREQYQQKTTSAQPESSKMLEDRIYGFPFFNDRMSNWKISKYIPICPSFKIESCRSRNCCSRCKKSPEDEESAREAHDNLAVANSVL